MSSNNQLSDQYWHKKGMEVYVHDKNLAIQYWRRGAEAGEYMSLCAIIPRVEDGEIYGDLEELYKMRDKVRPGRHFGGY